MSEPILFDQVMPGDRLIADAHFSCIESGAECVVQSDDCFGLFVPCCRGQHFLDGAIGEHGFLVGFTRRAA